MVHCWVPVMVLHWVQNLVMPKVYVLVWQMVKKLEHWMENQLDLQWEQRKVADLVIDLVTEMERELAVE